MFKKFIFSALVLMFMFSMMLKPAHSCTSCTMEAEVICASQTTETSLCLAQKSVPVLATLTEADLWFNVLYQNETPLFKGGIIDFPLINDNRLNRSGKSLPMMNLIKDNIANTTKGDTSHQLRTRTVE